jgi:hypothetical protein
VSRRRPDLAAAAPPLAEHIPAPHCDSNLALSGCRIKTLNIADVYDLPALSPYGFDRSFDAKIGYRTKSMLCAPLLSRTGDVVGVIQLINKKRDPEKKLLDADDVEAGGRVRRGEELLSPCLAGRHRARERAPLRRDPTNLRGLRARERAGDRAARQPPAATRAASPIDRGPPLVERVSAGPPQVSWTKDDLRGSVRLAPTIRQDRRAGRC